MVVLVWVSIASSPAPSFASLLGHASHLCHLRAPCQQTLIRPARAAYESCLCRKAALASPSYCTSKLWAAWRHLASCCWALVTHWSRALLCQAGWCRPRPSDSCCTAYGSLGAFQPAELPAGVPGGATSCRRRLCKPLSGGCGAWRRDLEIDRFLGGLSCHLLLAAVPRRQGLALVRPG